MNILYYIHNAGELSIAERVLLITQPLVPDLDNTSGGSVKQTTVTHSVNKHTQSHTFPFSVGLRIVLPIIFFSIFILLWHILHSTNTVPAFILPSPVSIATRFVTDFHILFPNAFYTLYIAIIGILLSIICAFVTALLLDIFHILYTVLYPFILLFQMVPSILFAPLLVLFFGYGTITKLIIIVLMCFFPILVTLLQGFKFVSLKHIQLLQTMGANAWQIYYWVKIPSALSQLFSGLRLAVSYAMTASIISEWVSSIQGLGYIMIQSQRSFISERIYAIIIIIFILSIGLYSLVLLLEYICIPTKRHTEQ